MMDEEKLDNELTRHISQVFDNYEDTGADEGWALLRQKYPPQEEKNRGLAWLWYAAAVVLLGLGLWFIQKPGTPQPLMVKQTKPVLAPKPVSRQPATISTDTLPERTAQNHNITPVKNGNAAAGKNKAMNIPADTLQRAAGSAALAAAGQHNVNAPLLSLNPGNKPANPLTQSNMANGRVSAPDKLVDPAALATNGKQPLQSTKDSLIKARALAAAIHNNTNNARTGQPNAADSAKKQAMFMAQNQAAEANKNANEKAFNSLFEGKNAPTIKADKTVMKGSKKAMFSVYAATYFNYAKGSDNQMNVGAGFTSDFKLTNKLKLSTGVSVGQNSLSYAANTPQQTGNFLSAAVAPATSFNSSNLAVAPKAAVPSKYNASLVGLDIPVNLKYLFNPQSDTYVAAGLSSGTFINETYQSVYSNAANTVTSVENTAHTSFNNFDFAKTLNVSFGIGYPLGKSNRLIVEPFLKYPLDGLGSQQLKFGAGGVNLKLNFQSSKK